MKKSIFTLLALVVASGSALADAREVCVKNVKASCERALIELNEGSNLNFTKQYNDCLHRELPKCQ